MTTVATPLITPTAAITAALTSTEVPSVSVLALPSQSKVSVGVPTGDIPPASVTSLSSETSTTVSHISPPATTSVIFSKSFGDHVLPTSVALAAAPAVSTLVTSQAYSPQVLSPDFTTPPFAKNVVVAAAAAATASGYVPGNVANLFGVSSATTLSTMPATSVASGTSSQRDVPLSGPVARQFPCSRCNLVFCLARSLEMHVGTAHGGFACAVCGKVYQHVSSLRAHDKDAHSQVVLNCDFPNCTKCFASQKLLKQHKLSHTPGAFPCNYCPARFTTQHNLKCHLRVHSGDKPFECVVCCKSFRRSDQLRTHERALAHIRKAAVVARGGAVEVSNPKPFACEHCGKAFAKEAKCVEHVRIHTGQTPFGCRICGGEFRTKKLLSRHQTKHEGEVSDEKKS